MNSANDSPTMECEVCYFISSDESTLLFCTVYMLALSVAREFWKTVEAKMLKKGYLAVHGLSQNHLYLVRIGQYRKPSHNGRC